MSLKYHCYKEIYDNHLLRNCFFMVDILNYSICQDMVRSFVIHPNKKLHLIKSCTFQHKNLAFIIKDFKKECCILEYSDF